MGSSSPCSLGLSAQGGGGEGFVALGQPRPLPLSASPEVFIV